jgi:hypothetical protein
MDEDNDNLFAAQIYEADSYDAVQERCHSSRWTDGLPIIPPTPDLVRKFLAEALIPSHHLVGVEPVRERAITAEQLAINAVMAGCVARHFPIVVAAFTAMLQDKFVLHGATSSTGGCAILVVINGPAVQFLGIDPTFNVLGSSDRATTCVGRAIRLSLQNILDVRPGEADRSTLGHPGKISFCMGEDEGNTSWLPLAQDRGIPSNTSAVTVFAAGSPRQIMNEWTTNPEEILDTYVSEIKASMLNYSIHSGDWAIVIPPQLRAHFEHAGWDKRQIREYVKKNAWVMRKDWASCGKRAVIANQGERKYFALKSIDDLLVIAAGGPAGGFGAVIPPWFGKTSRATTMAIGACVDCEI